MAGALSVIREQLPRFWEEEAVGGLRGLVKGLGDIVGARASAPSVMAAPTEESRMRGALSAIAPFAYAAPFVGPAFRVTSAYPRVAGLGLAAATGDPTMAFLSPAGLGLTYSSDAEASKFTDSLKAIDKFLAAHGTPHIFPPTETNPLGAFDMSKLGSGEGVQAFMAGHYLAGDPKISRVHYRDRLVNAMNSQAINEANAAYANRYAEMVKELLRDKMHPAAATAMANKIARGTDLDRSLKAIVNEKRVASDWADMMATRQLDLSSMEYKDIDPVGALTTVASRELAKLVEPMSWAERFSEDMLPAYTKYQSDANEVRKIIRPVVENARRQAYGEAVAKFPDSGNWENRSEYTGLRAEQIVRDHIEKMPDAVRARVERQFDPTRMFHAGEGFPQLSMANWLAKKVKKIATTKAALEQKEGLLAAKGKAKEEAAAYAEPELKQGALYTVEVGASPGSMLPLDIPLKELREDMPDVYKAYNESLQSLGQRGLSSYNESDTPMSVWRKFPKKGNYPERLMEELNTRGVPGNLFLSSGRRDLDTSMEFDPAAFNYVIFNDEIPKIIAREIGKKRVKFAEGGIVDRAARPDWWDSIDTPGDREPYAEGGLVRERPAWWDQIDVPE